MYFQTRILISLLGNKISIESGNDDSEDFYGSAGNDFLDSASDENFLDDGKGNDSIIGRYDNNTLLDNSGNDNLTANR